MKKLTDITLAKYACTTAAPTCPAVFQSENQTYVIVGKKVNSAQYPALTNRVAQDEVALEVSMDLIQKALCGEKQ